MRLVTPQWSPRMLHFANIATGILQSFPLCVRLWLIFPPFPFSSLNIELMGCRESQWLFLLEFGEWKENIPLSAGFKIPFGLVAITCQFYFQIRLMTTTVKSVMTRRWKMVSVIQGRGSGFRVRLWLAMPDWLPQTSRWKILKVQTHWLLFREVWTGAPDFKLFSFS